MPNAQVHQVLADGDARAACAVDHHMGLADLLAHHPQGVEQGRTHHNGGAVLVVMEHGDIANLLEPALDLKAPGRGDILQVDAAKAAGNQINGAHDLVHILAADADGEGVHPAKGLEQGAFSLHDGHARLRADIPQAQYRRAVGDDGHQVVPPGQVKGAVIILLDLQTGLGHAGRVSHRKLILVGHRHPGDHLDLPLPFPMQAQRLFRVIHFAPLQFYFASSSRLPSGSYFSVALTLPSPSYSKTMTAAPSLLATGRSAASR